MELHTDLEGQRRAAQLPAAVAAAPPLVEPAAEVLSRSPCGEPDYARILVHDQPYLGVGGANPVVVTLRQSHVGSAGTDDEALVAVGKSLVAFRDGTLLLGPGVVIGGNSVLLAYLMCRSPLVPRFIAVLGLVGGPRRRLGR